jgi:surface antigen/LysM repeat protein
MFNKRNRRRSIRYILLASNVAMLIVVITFVLQKPQTSGTNVSNAILTPQADAVANPVDNLSSADIALNVARVTQLPETTSVANLADTVNSQLTVTPANDIVVAQPNIIATGAKSRADVQSYTVQAGDTVPSVAAKFGVTSETIRWSNSINGDVLRPGSVLTISPVNGIVYVVQVSDTIDELVARYRVNKEQFIAFNDLESGQLPVGQRIVLPDGQPPAAVASSRRSPFLSAPAGFAATFGGNGYDRGYCTWWAAMRRSQIGRPIPSNLGNASTWLSRAAAAGYSTGRAPREGAVIWTPPRDFYGHVGFVESVNPDGSVNISEMNVAGWNRVSRTTLSPEQAARYSYIY